MAAVASTEELADTLVFSPQDSRDRESAAMSADSKLPRHEKRS